MTNQKTKWFNRGVDSTLSSLRVLIAPLVNFTAAYIVIQQSGQPVWGQFVEVLIFISLTSMFLGFGIKDYVLREASLKPKQLGSLVKSGLLVRSTLLVPSILIGILIFPPVYVGWFACWMVAMLVYSGINPIVDFNRSYKPAIIAELLFGGFLILFLLLKKPDLFGLIMAFSLSTLLRSLVLTVLFRVPISNGEAKFEWKLLSVGIPFLAMGFTGMLQSKTDLYLVAALLGDGELAVYQVTINFFVYMQALSGLMLVPFIKNLIRLPQKVVLTISLKFAVFGLSILLICLPIIYWFLNHIYAFDLGLNVMIIGGLLVLPTFIYLPMVYRLIGQKREKLVLYINLLGVLFNLIFSYVLVIQLGFIGGLLGGMISQWVMFGCYYFTVVYKSNDR